jgi:hypothetical protein
MHSVKHHSSKHRSSKHHSKKHHSSKHRSKKKMPSALIWMHKKVKQLRLKYPNKKFTWYAREAGRLYRKAHGKAEKSDKPTRARRHKKKTHSKK